jgi:hypothetical protein
MGDGAEAPWSGCKDLRASTRSLRCYSCIGCSLVTKRPSAPVAVAIAGFAVGWLLFLGAPTYDMGG